MLCRPIGKTAARCGTWRQSSPYGVLFTISSPSESGTDRARAIIADTCTFDNVRRATQATADYFKSVDGFERAVFVGFDVRFQSKAFARVAAEVLATNGFNVV